jgi:flagellar biosynthesis regulator FlaF
VPPNPYNVYSKVQKVHLETPDTTNSREIDSRALLVCASALNDAKELLGRDPKSKDSLKAYGDAIRKNQNLWTIFQVALLDPENQLPPILKNDLYSLSHYVDKASFRAIGAYRPEVIDSLIGINRIIAAGLTKNAENAATQKPVPQTEVPTFLTTSA